MKAFSIGELTAILRRKQNRAQLDLPSFLSLFMCSPQIAAIGLTGIIRSLMILMTLARTTTAY